MVNDVSTKERQASKGDEVVWVREPTAQERSPIKTVRRARVLDISLGIAVPALFIIIWQISSQRGWIDRRLYPPPTEVFQTAVDLFESGRLWTHTWITVKRIIIGYTLGAAIGIVFGLLMGMFRYLRSALEPTLNALYTVPKLALLPIFLTLFGIGEGPINALMTTTVFFFVWIATMSAVLSVPYGYREAGKSLRLSRLQLFWHVLLPAALPQIFVGLRIAAGVAVLMVIGVEFVIGGSGLGFLIEQGRMLLMLGQSFTAIVIVAVIGLLFAMLVSALGRLAAPWAEQNGGRTTL